MNKSYTIEKETLFIHDFKDRFDDWSSGEWRERITALVIS